MSSAYTEQRCLVLPLFSQYRTHKTYAVSTEVEWHAVEHEIDLTGRPLNRKPFH